MRQKDGSIYTDLQIRKLHPQVSFAANTYAELGYTDYTPPPYVPTQQDIDRAAALAALQADKTSALAYAKLTALSNMTPAQIQTWVDANVTNLATAQDAIKTLAVGLSVLIRRERLTTL